MPQMKPMNWIILFIFMNMIILLMNIKNFFKKNMNLNYNNLYNKNLKSKNWLW